MPSLNPTIHLLTRLPFVSKEIKNFKSGEDKRKIIFRQKHTAKKLSEKFSKTKKKAVERWQEKIVV